MKGVDYGVRVRVLGVLPVVFARTLHASMDFEVCQCGALYCAASPVSGWNEACLRETVLGVRLP